MSIRTALLTLSLLGLPACALDRDLGFPDEDSGAPNDADQATFSGDEGAAPKEEPAAPDLLLACDLPFPCEDPLELVRGSVQGYSAGDLCAFEALASGRPGLVQAVAVFPSAEAYLDHVPTGPGEVLRQAHGRSDGLGVWQKPAERCTLKPAAFFAACAQAYDPACLDPEAWIADCETLGSLTCPGS